MRGFLVFLLVLILIAGAGYGTYTWQHNKVSNLKGEVSYLQSQVNSKNNQPQTQTTTTTDSQSYTSKKGVKVKVYYPTNGATVTSPVAVVGEVPGNWSFEASFPIQLTDSKGTLVAKGTATLLGDWTTDKLVPFSAKLTFTSAAATGTGTLTLSKDNPSGIAANDDSVTIPIKL
jgi:uncharacterized protein YxeA